MNSSTPAEVALSDELVSELLRRQHPDLAHLSVRLMSNGWDNNIYALGDDLLVRMPRRQMAAQLVINEQSCLPVLAPRLPIAVPSPVRVGVPDEDLGCPWRWSVVPFFRGEIAARSVLADPHGEARRLAEFLRALHVAAPDDAPENQFRGGDLVSRIDRVEKLAAPYVASAAGRELSSVDAASIVALYSSAMEGPRWAGAPVWLHGDLHSANIIVNEGSIAAVVDWGDVCSGDPACDLAVAWMLFDDDARATFFRVYGAPGDGAGAAAGADAASLQARARAWALLFGLVYWEASAGDALMAEMSATVLGRVLG